MKGESQQSVPTCRLKSEKFYARSNGTDYAKLNMFKTSKTATFKQDMTVTDHFNIDLCSTT